MRGCGQGLHRTGRPQAVGWRRSLGRWRAGGCASVAARPTVYVRPCRGEEGQGKVRGCGRRSAQILERANRRGTSA